ncbi:MAG: prepilin-type N-terminal cleavage/methylation domain-containing protein, partial [Lachnospiraceae bacterium]|nr:prepilin-type N-terminal cleavage/methylation domain-containing protein [Lachnospiraceae bacterium]
MSVLEKISASYKTKNIKRGFSLSEVLIALAVVAVIAVLIIPVVTTRAQNRSFSVGYESEVKQMLTSLENLPASENRDGIKQTMMYAASDTGKYGNTSGAYINKYMKVSKYCGDTPGDCFGSEYYQYENNDRTSFSLSNIKGACALLKNGVSICLKPQLTKSNGRDIIDGWIDLNGPKGPNIYGRDLRTFSINLRQGAAFTQEDPGSVIISSEPTPCEGENCGIDDDPCKLFPQGEECCKKPGKILKDENDVCCPWYMSPSDSPNYIICNPDPTICDPSHEECDIQKCLNHTVTGPDDECCTILEVSGHPDPLCCKVNSSSTYCCKLNPNTEACCEARLSKISDYSGLNQNDACCKISSIKEKYSFCQDVCSKDNDSEECCKTISRRNIVN